MRKHLLDYDNVMNQQRNAIYKMRRNVLEGKDINSFVLEVLADVINSILDRYLPEGSPKNQWNVSFLISTSHLSKESHFRILKLF